MRAEQSRNAVAFALVRVKPCTAGYCRAMDEAGSTPAECRRLREGAQVSIHEMARKLHRDPSSLSRWERGLQIPRDVEHVIAAYRALEPMVRARNPAPQPIRKVFFRVSMPFVAFLVARWVLLALVVTFGIGLGAGEPFAPDAVRVFICFSGLLALSFVIVRILDVYEREPISLRGLLFIGSWALGVLYVTQRSARMFGSVDLHVEQGLALLAIEIGLIALAWRVDETASDLDSAR